MIQGVTYGHAYRRYCCGHDDHIERRPHPRSPFAQPRHQKILLSTISPWMRSQNLGLDKDQAWQSREDGQVRICRSDSAPFDSNNRQGEGRKTDKLPSLPLPHPPSMTPTVEVEANFAFTTPEIRQTDFCFEIIIIEKLRGLEESRLRGCIPHTLGWIRREQICSERIAAGRHLPRLLWPPCCCRQRHEICDEMRNEIEDTCRSLQAYGAALAHHPRPLAAAARVRRGHCRCCRCSPRPLYEPEEGWWCTWDGNRWPRAARRRRKEQAKEGRQGDAGRRG